MFYRDIDKAALTIELPTTSTDFERLMKSTRGICQIGFRRISIFIKASDSFIWVERCLDTFLSSHPNTYIVFDDADELRCKAAYRYNNIMIKCRIEDLREGGLTSDVPLLVDVNRSVCVDEINEVVNQGKDSVTFANIDPWEVADMLSKYHGQLKIWDDIRSAELLREHPCFTNLCKAEAAHCKRVVPPRKITIRQNGCVTPYGLPAAYSIGSLDRSPLDEILYGYIVGRSGDRYRKLMRRVIGDLLLLGSLEIIDFDSALLSKERELQ